jgi:predicted nucleotide-binding protein
MYNRIQSLNIQTEIDHPRLGDAMTKSSAAAAAPERARAYISQADIPGTSLEKALRIAAAIGENYGFKAATPLQVAKALEVAPTTGGFKMLTGASMAYGLTTGGYNAATISITPLGLRIVRPTSEGDDIAAKREAVLKPRIIREFLQRYNGAPIPRESIAQNVLAEMGVPQERAADVLKLVLESAESVGFLQDIKDRKYVDLSSTTLPADSPTDDEMHQPLDDVPAEPARPAVPPSRVSALSAPSVPITTATDGRARKVFITHGKNKALIEPIKKLLTFGELEAMVSVQTQTVSQSVPGKVMEEMRSCGAAIIHVEDERHLVDKEGNEHVVLNDNVLIEIGAAMALYGQRFILVVKEGVKLPSNLAGLLELRYKGDTLDMEETVKLLEAINDMKRRPLP